MNFYQYAKNQATSSIFSLDIIDLKILQFDWLRALIPISQEPDYGVSAGIQKIIETFILEQIQKKLMTKFFNKFKKTYFWLILTHFPKYWGQDFFLKKSSTVMHKFIWVSNIKSKD